jgi:hypothetical protein
MVVFFFPEYIGRGEEMRVTLSRFILAKRELDDPATDGLRSRVLSPMGGFLKEEIRVIFINGGDR